MRRAAVLALVLLPSLAAAQDFFTLKGHGGPIMGIAVSPSGQIATASFDNAIGVWTGQTPHWLEGHRAAINAVTFWDDATLVSAGDDFEIRVWDTLSDVGTRIGRHEGKIVDLALSPATGLVASASWEGTIGLWPLPSPWAKAAHSPPEHPSILLEGHDQGVNSVAFSEDGTRLYSASVDGTIRVWNVDQAEQWQVLVSHGFGINEMVLNEEGNWLAYGAVDGVTRVIDLTTGAELQDFTLDRRPILALAQSGDGRLLAVGDGEGYIMVIDTRNWRIAHDFRATLHGPIWALAFSPDGANIHAGGLDEAMYSWPVAHLGEHGPMAGTEQNYLKDPAEMSNGERQFARKCSICHSLSPGSARRAGPSLYRLFGRASGTVSDYSYSDRLSTSDIIWNADSINALFDLGPDHYIPGSKMPMQRITDPDDRADLIAYMRDATAGEPTK
ncbi:c-type cytochrome [Sedimentitalea todarodis]|uniref:C-type cytochrome n=1 Tax=Sedimentitalea todarodis TaxID=1631240 RepID=A0ABU3VEK1_9RHOB|nr:c-type cytochrome [Sedimentitalea todarodis]MDU9004599.1 c-type cytochrome [Sedimentitalea todarodis]